MPANAYIAYTVWHNKPMLDEALEADSVTVLLRLLNITPETYEECTWNADVYSISTLGMLDVDTPQGTGYIDTQAGPLLF